VDDRMVDAPAQGHEEPLTRRQRVNMALRWLGFLLPLLSAYWLGLWLGFGRAGFGGFKTAVGATAVLWLAFTIALAWRRDWRGAAAITACYLLVDAWWFLLAFDVIHSD